MKNVQIKELFTPIFFIGFIFAVVFIKINISHNFRI